MNRLKIAPSYSPEYLEVDRPQVLSDLRIESLINDVISGKLDCDITDTVYTNFIQEMNYWLHSSKLNTLTGLKTFDRIDIINGCTQFIDACYMNGPIQVLKGDYRYHERLGLYKYSVEPKSLVANTPLIIAMPFPKLGAPHEQMQDILNESVSKNISVHIDGAWITCTRDISFDFNHPAIKSVGISLSKGLGLGWNRIGLRWTKDSKPDAVTIMNDFRMNLRAPAMIGLHFIRNLPTDYLWNTYGDTYYKICKDFDLAPTQSIHIALRNNQPVGLSPLIRYASKQ